MPHCFSLFPIYCFQKLRWTWLMISSQTAWGQPLAVGALYTARSLRLVGYTFGSCSADANEPQTAAKSVSNVICSEHVQTQSASGFMESPVIVQILTVFRCIKRLLSWKKCGGHCWMMQFWIDDDRCISRSTVQVHSRNAKLPKHETANASSARVPTGFSKTSWLPDLLGNCDHGFSFCYDRGLNRNKGSLE